MMLVKDALEVVSDRILFFYSKPFVVEEASGSWKPVIDLSPLNMYGISCKATSTWKL